MGVAAKARTRVLLFARAPEAGQVKTRLIPRLGSDGAATLHARLVTCAVREAALSEVGPIELWCTPSTQHPLFESYTLDKAVSLHRQQGASLGDRMAYATKQATAHGDSALLVGTDVPALSAARLRDAAHALAHHEAVIVPALDGGYVLLGLQRHCDALFDGVLWGSGLVYEQTIQTLSQLAWRWRALEPSWDVDRPEDLDRLARHQPDLLRGLPGFD